MISIKFQELRGNNAPKRIARDNKAHEAAKALAGSVFEVLAGLEGLTSEESEALAFIKAANPQLVYSFAQCKDTEAAKAKYTHFADFGERRYYSVATAPVNVFDLLANLSTGYRLYKAAKLVTKAAEKPKTLQSFVAEKRLPAGVFEAARDLFISQWFDYMDSLQLSRGSILDNCKASELTEAEATAILEKRAAEAKAAEAATTEAATTEAEAAPVAEATEAEAEATEAATTEAEAEAAKAKARQLRAKAEAAEAKAAETGARGDKAAATRARKAAEAAEAEAEALAEALVKVA